MDRFPHWPPTPRGALHNARDALGVISSAVADRLEDQVVGRLAYIARADAPDIVPVNYVLDGKDILIRSGPGPKLQAAERRARVAFEVDDVDATSRTGRSVVVIGRATRLPATDRRHHSQPHAPWASGPRQAIVVIRPERVAGRRLS